MPGSAFYFVWTQQRDEFERNPDFEMSQSFHRLVSAQSDNVFLVKLTYYLSR
jgi:hypothetical protein